MQRHSSDMTSSRTSAPAGGDTTAAATAAGEPPCPVETFDLLTRLRLLCAAHPGFDSVRGRGVLHISRQDGQGFAIKVYDLTGPPLVVLGPWCGEVAGDVAVLSLVRKAMNGAVRIRIESCRGRDHSWTAEVKNNDSWVAFSQNRIAELWPLHATAVRYLTMPPSPTSTRERAIAEAGVRQGPEWKELVGRCQVPVKPGSRLPAVAAVG
jgi:hypothetical protein